MAAVLDNPHRRVGVVREAVRQAWRPRGPSQENEGAQTMKHGKTAVLVAVIGLAGA